MFVCVCVFVFAFVCVCLWGGGLGGGGDTVCRTDQNFDDFEVVKEHLVDHYNYWLVPEALWNKLVAWSVRVRVSVCAHCVQMPHCAMFLHSHLQFQPSHAYAHTLSLSLLCHPRKSNLDMSGTLP